MDSISFSTHAAGRIMRAVRRIESLTGIGPQTSGRQPGQEPLWTSIVKLSAEIAPSTSATLETGTATVYRLSTDGAIESSSLTIDLYNASTISLSTDGYHLASREPITGKWFSIGDASAESTAEVKMGYCVTNWRNHVSPRTIDVRASTTWGVPGSTTIIEVTLPSNSGHPNLVAGNPIAFAKASTRYICVSHYMDEAIGSIKLANKVISDQGWGLMNGTANASSLGGSGMDMRSMFVRHGTVDNIVHGVTTDYLYQKFASGPAPDFGGAGVTYIPSGSSDSDTLYNVVHTDKYTSTGGVLTSTDSGCPPYKYLLFHERLDNSEST